MIIDMKDEGNWYYCKKHLIKKVRDKYGTRKLDVLVYDDSVRLVVESDNPNLQAILLTNEEFKIISKVI